MEETDRDTIHKMFINKLDVIIIGIRPSMIIMGKRVTSLTPCLINSLNGLKLRRVHMETRKKGKRREVHVI